MTLAAVQLAVGGEVGRQRQPHQAGLAADEQVGQVGLDGADRAVGAFDDESGRRVRR